MSQPSGLTIMIKISYEVTLPPSIIMMAGDETEVTVQISAEAPQGGVMISLSSEDISVAQVTPNIIIEEGQTSGTFTVTALSSEQTIINASIEGSWRAGMTVAVNGGVVSGKVLTETDPGQLEPVADAGAEYKWNYYIQR